MSFKELAQLKQVGTPIEYMLEFQILSVKVDNVSMVRLVFLFTEVLEEPLKGLVKAHKPTNLNDTMSLTRDLQNVLPRTRFPPKPNFKFERKPWKKDAPDKNFWQKDTLEKNNKEDKTRMNFKGKNCASHASNHGHRGINVLKEKLNT